MVRKSNFTRYRCAIIAFLLVFIAGCGSNDALDSNATGDTPACDNGQCEAGETCANCPQDCASGCDAVWWKPDNSKPMHLHWQLSDEFNYPDDLVPGHTVYDIDGDLNTADTVAKLHADGFRVICYMEVGSVENYRDDYQDFVDAGVVGRPMSDWPGEYWLDISTQENIDKILPLMQARMINWCRNKGFDAIEPDTSDVEGASDDQVISYNLQIAEMAHSLGLGIGLKNNAGAHADALEPYYDWALVEECWQYDECDSFVNNFLKADKPVWNVEYSSAPDCDTANSWHMLSIRRELDLVGPNDSGYRYETCIPDLQDTW